MKKILLIIQFLFFIGCSNTQKLKFKPFNSQIQLEPGDILIKEKNYTTTGFLGHSAIMESKTTVVDYPKIGNKGYKININYWIEKNRKIIVLRYKNMNDKFKKDLIKNIRKYAFLDYKISVDRLNNKSFYCSQYVWYVYYKTAQDNGFYLDIDKNKGDFIFPYDLINPYKFQEVY